MLLSCFRKRMSARYKFVVAVENAVCPDYVTEKLWRALEVGAVPIYHGAPNVREILPHGGFELGLGCSNNLVKLSEIFPILKLHVIMPRIQCFSINVTTYYPWMGKVLKNLPVHQSTGPRALRTCQSSPVPIFCIPKVPSTGPRYSSSRKKCNVKKTTNICGKSCVFPPPGCLWPWEAGSRNLPYRY